MESLFANYASSDEDEQEDSEKHQQQQHVRPNSSNPGRAFPSLPPPKSSSSPFRSLPPPKSQSKTSPNLTTSATLKKQEFDEEEEFRPRNVDKPSSFLSSLPQPKSTSSSSLFSVLPPPKTTKADAPVLPSPLSSSDPKPKRVVQFKPPVNPFALKSNSVDEDEEDEDEVEKEKQRKKSESFTQTASVKSFLSSIPAPKNYTTLGVLGSGSGRRSTIEADVPVHNVATSNEVLVNSNNESQQVESSMGGFDGPSEQSAIAGVGGDCTNWNAQGYVNHEGYAGYGNEGASDYSHAAPPNVNYADYNSSYGTYTGYEQYGPNWTDGSSATTASAVTETAEIAFRLPGKRGRNDAPPQIVEVNQDELMKNRPREDQTRLTGIAFGPSYQPVSSKGKPSKLLKRKHQISTLYFDMKQKEMELAERRAKGMLTKAQTQGKYGW
ncbi:hypothetical protein K7X08_033948 [Anisodus acutangulus]|uniref:Proline-rich protein PRCC n=1 Tax=Anisodus acutangulus TaxID=402998 RepID=A0A9Q1MMK1_9SOLA|nr:hypothetical protein K7X08_033948 [Anisodus acutangulus]